MFEPSYKPECNAIVEGRARQREVLEPEMNRLRLASWRSKMGCARIFEGSVVTVPGQDDDPQGGAEGGCVGILIGQPGRRSHPGPVLTITS